MPQPIASIFQLPVAHLRLPGHQRHRLRRTQHLLHKQIHQGLLPVIDNIFSFAHLHYTMQMLFAQQPEIAYPFPAINDNLLQHIFEMIARLLYILLVQDIGVILKGYIQPVATRNGKTQWVIGVFLHLFIRQMGRRRILIGLFSHRIILEYHQTVE